MPGDAIDSIISSAITSIDSGGSDGGSTGDTGGDAGTDTSSNTGTDALAADAADAGTDAGTEGAEADATGQPADAGAAGGDVRSPEDIAFDAELAELGLAAPKPGQRDNRIPYSRLRKIVANAKTKWSETLKGQHTTELTTREQKIQEIEAREKAVERMAEADPEGYIGLLAKIYPDKYGRFLKPQAPGAKADDKPQEPQPDVKYSDGTVGYSPEQFAKLRDYDRKEAARIAKDDSLKEFNERFGPIEKEYQAGRQTQADIQRVRGHIGQLKAQWGADIIDNPEVQKDIIAHMDANPKATLVESTRVVAMKRFIADRTKMRSEILEELRGAPKAAAKTPQAPNRSDANTSESLEDIITRAARSIR